MDGDSSLSKGVCILSFPTGKKVVAEGEGDVVDRETTSYTGMNEPPGRWTPWAAGTTRKGNKRKLISLLLKEGSLVSSSPPLNGFRGRGAVKSFMKLNKDN